MAGGCPRRTVQCGSALSRSQVSSRKPAPFLVGSPAVGDHDDQSLSSESVIELIGRVAMHGDG
jgi:hypothetical protein